MDRKELPAELAHFVRQALASGTFQSEEELVVEAVRLLLRGGSVIDWHRLDFRDGAEVDRFLRISEFRPDDERPPRHRTNMSAPLRRRWQQAIRYGRVLWRWKVRSTTRSTRSYTRARMCSPHPQARWWPRHRHHGQPSRRITPGSPCTGKPIAATGLHCGQGSYCMPRPPWMTSSHTSAMSAGVAFC